MTDDSRVESIHNSNIMERDTGPAPPLERFSQAIAGLLLYLREGEDHSIQFFEGILPQLQIIGRAAADAIAGLSDDSSVRELHLHALDQVVATAQLRWNESMKLLKGEISKQKGDDQDNDERWFEQQQVLARSTELILIFIRITVDIQSTDIKDSSSSSRIKTMNDSEDSILQEYAEYQRQLLRQRSKPPIASLVALRRNGAFSSAKQPFQSHPQDDLEPPEVKHHHADAIATILQHSAHLQHPLLSWRASYPSPPSLITLCDTSIQSLQKQAVELVLPLATWFYEDHSIEYWLKQTSNKDDVVNASEAAFLPRMDAAVSELSDICRMLQEYMRSVAPPVDLEKESNVCKLFGSIHASVESLIAEWTVHYGALEAFLVLQQYNSTVPQAIVTVVDSEIRVPSMVEDAHCLTMNALQRAPSLQTIAFALAHDVWSTEAGTSTSTVFGALERRVGCQVIPDRTEVAPSSGNFADALASAIDEPSFAVLDEHFCYWNGMYAASAAVRSFGEALADDADTHNNKIEKSAQEEVTMLSIVRDDLERFGHTYESTVDQHLSAFVESLDFWDMFRTFFQEEKFDLGSASEMSVAEADERLDARICQPLQSSRFAQQIPLKAEAQVQQVIWEKVASHATALLLGVIWELRPQVTEWGALLFAKEMRVLRAAILCEKDSSWAGLSEVVTLLQIEQPSDWLIYRDDVLKCLEIEQVAVVLSLRVDFSKEAVASVVH